MTFEVEITQSDPRFFEALQNPDGFIPVLGEAMKNIIDTYEERASVYAPESEANKPGRFNMLTHEPMGFYERGRGWWYPLLTHNTMGLAKEIPLLHVNLKAPHTKDVTTLMASGIRGVAGYRLIENSEQMHDRWTTEVQQNASEVIGKMSNSASYSGLVQGLLQVTLHRSRGWKTVVDTWESPEMQQVVTDETIKAIDQYYNL